MTNSLKSLPGSNPYRATVLGVRWHFVAPSLPFGLILHFLVAINRQVIPIRHNLILGYKKRLSPAVLILLWVAALPTSDRYPCQLSSEASASNKAMTFSSCFCLLGSLHIFERLIERYASSILLFKGNSLL